MEEKAGICTKEFIEREDFFFFFFGHAIRLAGS